MDKFHSNPIVFALKWLASESGWIELNTDGDVSTSTQLAYIGGIICDANYS